MVDENKSDGNSNEDMADRRQQRITKALESGVEQIYFNSFANGIGAGDVTIVLERNTKLVAILNTSYTVAKTLASKLASLIGNLEETTGNLIMTTDEVESKFSLRKTNGPDSE